MYQIQIDDLIRINKRLARRLYNQNIEIIFTPCKLTPKTFWNNGIIPLQGYDFTKICAELEYYNCNNEAGKYLSYYVHADDLDNFEN